MIRRGNPAAPAAAPVAPTEPDAPSIDDETLDDSSGVDLALRLRKTGAIAGQVQAQAGSGVTDLTGVDVFVPGTSPPALPGHVRQ